MRNGSIAEFNFLSPEMFFPGPATAAELNGPRGLAIDTAGNIFVTEYLSSRIRKINAAGIITTIAGGGSTYIDGVAATATSLDNPVGVAVDRAGNIYLDDYAKSVIRKINTSGVISCIAGTGSAGFSGDGGQATAAKLNQAYGIAVDTSGNIYVADGYFNNRIRKINNVGIITTIAGNGIAGYSGDSSAATSAELYAPYGVSVDNNGNIFIADFLNNRIRIVDTSGIIRTYAGNGVWGFGGDGALATLAQIGHPTGVYVDNSHNVYIVDYNNQRIRKVDAPVPVTFLDAISVDNTIKLYPNPGKSELNIAAIDKITSVNIKNLLGQTVYIHEYNTEKVQVDVSNLPSGIYLIKINGTEVRKFVKQ